LASRLAIPPEPTRQIKIVALRLSLLAALLSEFGAVASRRLRFLGLSIGQGASSG